MEQKQRIHSSKQKPCDYHKALQIRRTNVQKKKHNQLEGIDVILLEKADEEWILSYKKEHDQVFTARRLELPLSYSSISVSIHKERSPGP